MSKYHISKRGEPELCSAQIRCRLGGDSGTEDHFETKEEAREAYEDKMRSEILGSGKPKEPSAKDLRELSVKDGKFILTEDSYKDMNKNQLRALFNDVQKVYEAAELESSDSGYGLVNKNLPSMSKELVSERDKLATLVGEATIAEKDAEYEAKENNNRRTYIKDNENTFKRGWGRPDDIIEYGSKIHSLYSRITDKTPEESADQMNWAVRINEAKVKQYDQELKEVGNPSIFKRSERKHKETLEAEREKQVLEHEKSIVDLLKFKKENNL